MADQEKYYLPVDGKMVEVTEEQYREFYRHKRREKYQKEQDQDNHVFHYSDLDTDEIVGEEMFSYPNAISVEEKVISKYLHEKVRRCMDELPEEDRDLIFALYFEGQTERAYAKEIGISQAAIRKRRKHILSQLKKMMNKL